MCTQTSFICRKREVWQRIAGGSGDDSDWGEQRMMHCCRLYTNTTHICREILSDNKCMCSNEVGTCGKEDLSVCVWWWWLVDGVVDVVYHVSHNNFSYAIHPLLAVVVYIVYTLHWCGRSHYFPFELTIPDPSSMQIGDAEMVYGKIGSSHPQGICESVQISHIP